LVEEHAAGKVDQYQSKGRPQWQVCHLPITGRLEKIVIGWVRGKFCFLDDGTGGMISTTLENIRELSAKWSFDDE
jgi:hypothetical protein